MSQFVHLRFHSEYSITDGIVRLDPIIEKSVSQGAVDLGITDLMNIFGGLRFYSHAIAAGLKPVVGCDLWVQNEEQDKRDRPYRLTVYCQNHEGYLSLCELLSRAWMENQYLGRGEIRMAWLTEEACKGLICLTGGPQGIVERHLVGKKGEKARQFARHLDRAFPGRLYLEVQRPGFKSDELLVSLMANLSVEMALPLVATHPIQFLEKDDFTAHEVRCCIAEGYVLADTRRPHRYTEQQYLKSAEEMQELFSDLPQALENTLVIAERCNLDGVLQKPQLPLFPTPDGMSLDDYMVKLAKEGLNKRLEFLYPDKEKREQVRPDYDKRLEYELGIIIKMKFPGYFLIVQDFINWSKRNGVPVGPGRGSGAGSLVAYSLGITDLDPLHYGLLFERFLNPERVSMPDFDVDFCQWNRDRTIEYVKRTYGVEAVSQIVTFGAMGAKAVVRDVGRALNMGYGQVDRLAKLIPAKPGMDVTLDKAAELEPDFKKLAESDEFRELMDYARKLEGITRNLGMHAGGVLIAPGKLTNFCPLYNADGRPENTVSQYDKKDVENVGLVKFDFLGLTTLTILGKAVEYIDRLNPGTHFDLSRIPTDDKETLALFQQGNTGAVFQFESSGMRDQLRQAKPDCLEDLVALNALYRPGPMDQIPHFIDRKFGREKVEYLDARMEPILRETYGIMVYQEQVMLVAQAVAGYSLGGADLLRRAMGKKNVAEMQRQRAVFIKGAAERNVDEKTATEIFNLMEKFAGYGFNKSHAAAYSYVAWQTAYLKAHHTACFVAGNLCLVMDQAEKMRDLVNDAREMGIAVNPPNINLSEWFFTVPDEKTLQFGLGAIKGMGQNIAEDIINERNRNGSYVDIFDLAARVPSVNRKTLEQLVRAGAFDVLDENRGKLFANIGQAISAAQTIAASVGQASLFADENGQDERIVNWIDADEWSSKRKFAEEREAFGFALTGMVFDSYKHEIEKMTTPYRKLREGKGHVVVAGQVVENRVILGKRGKFDIVTVSDGVGQMDFVVSGGVYDRYRSCLMADEVLFFKGRVRADKLTQKMSLSADEILTIDQWRSGQGVTVRISACGRPDLVGIRRIIEKFSVQEGQEGAPVAMSLGSLQEGLSADQIWLGKQVSPSDDLRMELQKLEGIRQVDFSY